MLPEIWYLKLKGKNVFPSNKLWGCELRLATIPAEWCKNILTYKVYRLNREMPKNIIWAPRTHRTWSVPLHYESQSNSFIVVVVLKVIWVGSLVAASARHGFNPWVRKIPWRRKWQPTPVWSPGKCHRQRSLVSYSLWKESDTKSRAQRVGHGWATEQAYTHAL